MEAPMKFVLEVDVPTGDAATELGNILRYWAANLQHYALTPGASSLIHDSGYATVGRWQIVGGEAADEVEEAFDDFAAYEDDDDEEEEAAAGGTDDEDSEEGADLYAGGPAEEPTGYEQTWS
jgi:hypothetical protein